SWGKWSWLGSAAKSRTARVATAHGLILRVVDPQAATLQVRAVELLLSALGVGWAGHDDEREPARLPAVPIGDHRSRVARADTSEELTQLVLGDGVGEISDEELLWHFASLIPAWHRRRKSPLASVGTIRYGSTVQVDVYPTDAEAFGAAAELATTFLREVS